MRVLKISELSRLIAKTNKGDLTLKIVFGATDYHYFLDSVKLDQELDEALKKILV